VLVLITSVEVAAPSGHDAESHRQRPLVQIEDPVLATTSVIMTVVFVAAYNFQISLAMSALETLAGDSRTYGSLMSAVGLGAVAGSLMIAR
jgi:hypothetical protein